MQAVISRRLLLAAGATLATGVGTCNSRGAESSKLAPIEPPQKAPAAAFAEADGKQHQLADYAGEGLVVNLWATWCAPCVAELPSLAALARSVQSDRIAVLPISSDRKGAEAVEAFYKAHEIAALPVLLDKDGTLLTAFGARGIPTTYIIDRKGFVRARAEGPVDWAAPAIVATIKRLVG